MRKMGFMFVLTFGLGLTTIGQEYDDLYFNKTDRKKAKKEKQSDYGEFEATYDFQFEQDVASVYSPEKSIEDYQLVAESEMLQYQSPYNSNNSEILTTSQQPSLSFQYSQQEIYDQGYEDGLATNSSVTNNYYGNNVRPIGNADYWNNSFYDPWNIWGMGWNVSFGWGNRWNNYYDPFYDPWYGYNSLGYNSWYRPNNSWSVWGRPIRNSYCVTPYYDYGGYYYAPNTVSKVKGRDVVRGARTSRGGAVTGSNTTNSRGTTSTASRGDGRSTANTQSRYSGNSQARTNGSQEGYRTTSGYQRRIRDSNTAPNRSGGTRTSEGSTYQSSRNAKQTYSRRTTTPSSQNQGRGTASKQSRTYSTPSNQNRTSNRTYSNSSSKSSNQSKNSGRTYSGSSTSSSRSSASRSNSPSSSRSSASRSSSSSSSRSSGASRSRSSSSSRSRGRN